MAKELYSWIFHQSLQGGLGFVSCLLAQFDTVTQEDLGWLSEESTGSQPWQTVLNRRAKRIYWSKAGICKPMDGNWDFFSSFLCEIDLRRRKSLTNNGATIANLRFCLGGTAGVFQAGLGIVRKLYLLKGLKVGFNQSLYLAGNSKQHKQPTLAIWQLLLILIKGIKPDPDLTSFQNQQKLMNLSDALASSKPTRRYVPFSLVIMAKY